MSVVARWFLILLVFGTLGGLTGCGGDDKKGTKGATPQDDVMKMPPNMPGNTKDKPKAP